MTSEYLLHVGIDWGSQHHDIVIADTDGDHVESCRIQHSSSGIATLLERLAVLSQDQISRVAIGIETPRGPVVEALVEHGAQVFACNPKQLDRFRDRSSLSRKKDDPFDGFLLSELVRTDRHLLRQVQLDDPLIIQLRELERLEAALGRDLVRHTNRLRDQLYRVLPQLLRLTPGADEPWLWDLLERAPTPERAARLQVRTLARLLKTNRIRRFTAGDLHALLAEPPLGVAPGVVEAASACIQSMLPILRTIAHQQRACQKQIDHLLDGLLNEEPETEGQHRDAVVIKSLPGVGRVILAAMLAEASQAIAQRDELRVRAEMGVAPVTRRSGKTIFHVMRYACNKRLKDAAYWWGMAAIAKDPRSRATYHAARARGHGHARAIRCVVEALIRVMMAMLASGTLYDATRRGARRQPRRDSKGEAMPIPA